MLIAGSSANSLPVSPSFWTASFIPWSASDAYLKSNTFYDSARLSTSDLNSCSVFSVCYLTLSNSKKFWSAEGCAAKADGSAYYASCNSSTGAVSCYGVI